MGYKCHSHRFIKEIVMYDEEIDIYFIAPLMEVLTKVRAFAFTSLLLSQRACDERSAL